MKRMLYLSSNDLTKTKSDIMQRRTVTEDIAKNVGDCNVVMDTKKDFGVQEMMPIEIVYSSKLYYSERNN